MLQNVTMKQDFKSKRKEVDGFLSFLLYLCIANNKKVKKRYED